MSGVGNVRAVWGKSNNFMDLAIMFRNFGVGKKFRRNTWVDDNCYWTVTRVLPLSRKVLPSFFSFSFFVFVWLFVF